MVPKVKNSPKTLHNITGGTISLIVNTVVKVKKVANMNIITKLVQIKYKQVVTLIFHIDFRILYTF